MGLFLLQTGGLLWSPPQSVAVDAMHGILNTVEGPVSFVKNIIFPNSSVDGTVLSVEERLKGPHRPQSSHFVFPTHLPPRSLLLYPTSETPDPFYSTSLNKSAGQIHRVGITQYWEAYHFSSLLMQNSSRLAICDKKTRQGWPVQYCM